VRDVARVVASMCDGIMARTFEHAKVLELAKWAKVPVINGLTDYNHPCQAMADVLTIEEHFGKLNG
jgi:ornithine carbamoyltransferase